MRRCKERRLEEKSGRKDKMKEDRGRETEKECEGGKWEVQDVKHSGQIIVDRE